MTLGTAQVKKIKNKCKTCLFRQVYDELLFYLCQELIFVEEYDVSSWPS